MNTNIEEVSRSWLEDIGLDLFNLDRKKLFLH